jgi:hypothetical protein
MGEVGVEQRFEVESGDKGVEKADCHNEYA